MPLTILLLVIKIYIGWLPVQLAIITNVKWIQSFSQVDEETH